jgi:serine/threonine protein kinase
VPKVSDFGMSRVLRADELEVSEKASRGPIKWQAPEELRGATRVHSYKTDVFSFAVLLAEIAPFLTKRPPSSSPRTPNARPSARAPRRTCAPSFSSAGRQSAAERPTMAHVVELLAK